MNINKYIDVANHGAAIVDIITKQENPDEIIEMSQTILADIISMLSARFTKHHPNDYDKFIESKKIIAEILTDLHDKLISDDATVNNALRILKEIEEENK